MSGGYKAWIFNKTRHRVGGPAVIHPNGDKEWWLFGVSYSEEEYNVLLYDTNTSLEFLKQ
jgi:hypothetical protein